MYPQINLPQTLSNLFHSQDAKLNEVDSGTELDSQAEDEVEEIGSVENVEKDETEKKED